MKRNLFKTFFLYAALFASFVLVPIACGSDDGSPQPPEEEQAVPDPTNSNTTIEATSPVVADGTATSTVTVRIADTGGKLLTASGGTVALSSTGSAVVSAVTDNGNGTYTATATNTTAETVTISGTLSGATITDTAEIIFSVAIGDPDPTNINTTIDAIASAIVDGTPTSTVTVQLADANGNLLQSSGGVITLATTGTATVSEIIDNEDGTYTATVTNTVEETVTISGALDGVAITDTAEITFNPDDSNPAQEVDQSTEPVGISLLRINCGGPEVTFGDITFLEDQFFGDNSQTFTNPFVTEIANTDMDAIYLTERVSADGPNFRGPTSYNIPVTNGTYTVKLYFAEIYWGVENPQMLEGGVGSRIFNISMENTEIFTGYDLFKEHGAASAGQRMYDIEVTDGELNIILQATVNKPKISAIEVFGSGTIGS